jgi:drug/metabolite transporter (DMT)-like permease
LTSAVVATVRADAVRHQHARGRLFVGLAAIAWSTAGVLQRELTVSPATQVAGRAFFAAVALFAFVLVAERDRALAGFRLIGRTGVALAVAMAVSSGSFMLALSYTTVANVVFMQAVAPMLAALLGRVILHEPVAPRMWAAMIAAAGGVALMVGGPDSGSWVGQALSFVMAFSFAVALVIVRHRRDVSMAPATCLSQVLLFAVAAPFADFAAATRSDVLLFVLLGAGQIGLGLALLTIGARLIPTAEVALISLLEIVLAPLWVWLAFSEQPGAATLAGGAIVLAAVVVLVRGDPRSSLAQGADP